MKLSEFIYRIDEVTMKAAIAKAEMRFNSFWEKTHDLAKFEHHINLRTKKMKDINKLLAWRWVLEDNNYHAEVAIASAQLRKLGYKGNFYDEIDKFRGR